MSAQGVVNAALRKRIERLESLIKRALATAAAAASSFAGPVVANEAAAAAFPLTDVSGGITQIFVLSHRSIWTKRNGVAGTQGVPPLVAHEVIAATAGPVGVLCRTTYSDPALRTGINDIFIDPANPAANDENDGLTALTPLQTGYELFRRWGWGTPVKVGPNLATSPLGFIVIHIQSNLVDPDSLPMNVICLRNSSGISIEGGPSTIIRTATLTDAVTAMNRAAPLGGTRLTIRDNTLANWSAFMAPNRRVRFTNGPAVGGTLQPQTDNVATPGQVQCSPCQTTNPNGFSLVPTTVTPAVGNTYVVESLVQVNLGQPFKVDNENNPLFVGVPFVNIVNCNIPAGAQAWAPDTGAGSGQGSSAQLNLYQCTIDRTVDLASAAATCIACYFFRAGIFVAEGKGFNAYLNGGGANTDGAIYSIVINASLDSRIDFDFIANRCALFGVMCPAKSFASWNAVAFAGPNAGGHGVIVGGGGAAPFFANRTGGVVTFNGTMWGNGSPGAGVQVSAGCTAVGAPQNITGTQGDGKLADFSSTVGNNVFWQAATGVFVGATGVAGVASAFTWALLAAAKAAPGYGFSVHNPDQMASWVASETSA